MGIIGHASILVFNVIYANLRKVLFHKITCRGVSRPKYISVSSVPHYNLYF